MGSRKVSVMCICVKVSLFRISNLIMHTWHFYLPTFFVLSILMLLFLLFSNLEFWELNLILIFVVQLINKHIKHPWCHLSLMFHPFLSLSCLWFPYLYFYSSPVLSDFNNKLFVIAIICIFCFSWSDEDHSLFLKLFLIMEVYFSCTYEKV